VLWNEKTRNIGTLWFQTPIESESETASKSIVKCMGKYRRGLDWWFHLLHTSTHDSWLQFTVRCYTHTTVLSVTVCSSRFPITASNGGRSRNISVPQLPASNSNNSQKPNCSSRTNSLTYQQTTLPCMNCTALTLTNYLIMLSHRKHRSSVAVQLLCVRNLLPSSGRCLQSLYLATGLHVTV
jgi:hypothetical protein